MNISFLENTAASLDTITISYPVGRIVKISGTIIAVSGISTTASLGDTVLISFNNSDIHGEIIRLDGSTVDVLLEETVEGLKLNTPVRQMPSSRFAPDDSWIGRVIDPNGAALDGRPLAAGPRSMTLYQTPPPAHQRKAMGERLQTSLAVFNTLLPLVRGQRIGLFAGSGVGKSTLIADLAGSMTADVIVIALVGERGREVRHFVDKVLGPEGMARSVIVAATSDRAPQVRRRCAVAAMTVAEYFRDQGLHVALFTDSVTRFCEAHREIALAAGEAASLRGFPTSTMAAIANLCERAGPGPEGSGDITAIFSVLVAGSDMEEPIADMLRGTLDGHIVLDRDIAESGRFPAIDVLRSVSRALPEAAERHENILISKSRENIGAYSQAKMMIQAGLYEPGSDAKIDTAISSHDALENFLTVRDNRSVAQHFQALGKIVQNEI